MNKNMNSFKNGFSGIEKFEKLELYVEVARVKFSKDSAFEKFERYDLKVVSLHETEVYHSLEREEVETVLRAYEILESHKIK